jgi:polar amino acid transport system permease protein
VIAAAFDAHTFWHYLWPPTAFQNRLILDGFFVTIYVAVLAQALGVIFGVASAIGQLSRFFVVRLLARTYVTYFRGTPLIVQLSLFYFGLSSLGLYHFPVLSIAGLTVSGVIQAGILGLAVNKGAYMSEIVRAGILSIDHGQTEAAQAIGMTKAQTMRWIVLPQAARVIVPPLGNEFNGTLKDTALLTTIGGVELFNAYEQLNSTLFQPFELFFAMSFYYLALTLCWSAIQSRIESHLGRGLELPKASSAHRWIGLGSARSEAT